LRATQPRILVPSTLRQRSGHRSVKENVAALIAHDTPPPRATLYNVIHALLECGLFPGAHR